MFFRNLSVYRLQGFKLSADELGAMLERHPLTPCTGIMQQSRGWVPVRPAQMAYGLGPHILVALGTEQKILPGSVVAKEVKARADAFEVKQGFKPGRKQMRELKELVITELLPKAFARQSLVRAWLAPGWIVIDSPSAGRAESVIDALRVHIGELQAMPVETSRSIAASLTAWVADGAAPGAFSIGDEAELVSNSAERARARFSNHDLSGKQVRDHVQQGKTVSRLGLTWNSRMGFVLTDSLTLKKVHFLDIEKNREEAQAENADEQFDADFALMTGQYSKLLDALMQQLGEVRS